MTDPGSESNDRFAGVDAAVDAIAAEKVHPDVVGEQFGD